MQHQTSCGRLTEKSPAEGVGHPGRICCYNGEKPPFIARSRKGPQGNFISKRAGKRTRQEADTRRKGLAMSPEGRKLVK